MISIRHDDKQGTRSAPQVCWIMPHGVSIYIRMIVPDTEDARREGKIKNVVYTEVFN